MLLCTVQLHHPISPACRAHSSKPAAVAHSGQQMGQTDGQTDGRTDTILLHRPCRILCKQCQYCPMHREIHNSAAVDRWDRRTNRWTDRHHTITQTLPHTMQAVSTLPCASCNTQRWTLTVINCTAKLMDSTSTVASIARLVRTTTI